MFNKAIILESTKKFKRGHIIEKYIPTLNGIITEEGSFIEKKNIIILTEKLSKSDEEQVKKIIREFMRLFLWRTYTRSSFLVK